MPATATVAASSPRTPATSRNPSVKPEPGFQIVDLTDNFIKSEATFPERGNSRTAIKRERSTTLETSTQTAAPINRQRPTPPLFKALNLPSKHRREDDENEDGEIPGPATKKARNDSGVTNEHHIPTQSVEPATLTADTSQSEGKRKRSEAENDEEQDLVELPPAPKRPKVLDIIDLTDD
jgi:hypothetical protein